MKYNLKGTMGLEVKHLPIIGHGKQGIVFNNGKYATKVFYSDPFRINSSDSNVAIKISSLNLEALVKPFNLKFRNNVLSSFDMEMIYFDKNQKVVDMNIEDVTSNISIIRDDINKLSEANIKVNDLQLHNIGIVGDKIRFFDFSEYSFSENENLKRINNAAIDTLFGSLCIIDEIEDINPMEIYDIVYCDYLRSGCSNIEEYFSLNISDNYKNIREFVYDKVNKKRLIKKIY